MFSVSIDFDQSHLLFPTIIICALAFMLLLALVLHASSVKARIASACSSLQGYRENTDFVRLIGVLVLVPVYFVAMEYVGETWFPNTGLGFLFTSIPFVFLLSTLFAQERDTKSMVTIAVIAVLVPSAVWYVLGELFAITLP